MASAAVGTLPAEAVVLISMSCLKMSRAIWLVGSRLCAPARGRKQPTPPNTSTHRMALCIGSPQMPLWEGNGAAAHPSNSLRFLNLLIEKDLLRAAGLA